ncbi:MAG: hypothetical protein GWP05_10995 [Anaerolineaceae bacterium]|nr:hypothetical protein [Anaerolineaceae bacterium]
MTTERLVLAVAVMMTALAPGLAGCGGHEPAEGSQKKATAAKAEDWTPNPALTARSSGPVDPADVKQAAPAPGFEFSASKTETAIYAVRFQTNRKAVFHCGDKEFAVPGTIWLDEERAPGGEPLLTFRGRVDGSHEFLYAGRVPCSFTDASGRPLVALKCTIDLAGEGTADKPFITVFKVHLAGP